MLVVNKDNDAETSVLPLFLKFVVVPATLMDRYCLTTQCCIHEFPHLFGSQCRSQVCRQEIVSYYSSRIAILTMVCTVQRRIRKFLWKLLTAEFFNQLSCNLELATTAPSTSSTDLFLKSYTLLVPR